MATYGEVKVEQKKISEMSKSEKLELHRRGIGMIFQAFYLIPSVNVIENVCLPKILCGEDKNIRNEEGMKLLRRFGIAEQLNKFPSELSGGQQQRVSIARSLINNPGLILADEPVGNLDSESAENVMKILKELNEIDKKTIILVTHNPAHLHYADRIIHMEDGKIVSEEINRDKRPESEIKEEISVQTLQMSNELALLMRTFKNMSLRQLGVLLIPFKAKQLLSHALSDLTEEQLSASENILKEFLFHNINIEALRKNLDTDFNKGGANWNKQRSESFAKRIEGIIEQVEAIGKMDPKEASKSLANYLVNIFKIKLDMKGKELFGSFLKMRIENKLDCFSLEKRLDASRILGGLGLYKNTAEKVVKEVEMIMLLKYSPS
jgi:putative ABC transport system ATP-binding protein